MPCKFQKHGDYDARLAKTIYAGVAWDANLGINAAGMCGIFANANNTEAGIETLLNKIPGLMEFVKDSEIRVVRGLHQQENTKWGHVVSSYSLAKGRIV
jgi:hypothetical protein